MLSFTLCDTSNRNIRHELRASVPMFELVYIHRDLDDTLANWFCAAIFYDCVEYTSNLRCWDSIGFDNLDIRFWLER